MGDIIVLWGDRKKFRTFDFLVKTRSTVRDLKAKIKQKISSSCPGRCLSEEDCRAPKGCPTCDSKSKQKCKAIWIHPRREKWDSAPKCGQWVAMADISPERLHLTPGFAGKHLADGDAT